MIEEPQYFYEVSIKSVFAFEYSIFLFDTHPHLSILVLTESEKINNCDFYLKNSNANL